MARQPVHRYSVQNAALNWHPARYRHLCCYPDRSDGTTSEAQRRPGRKYYAIERSNNNSKNEQTCELGESEKQQVGETSSNNMNDSWQYEENIPLASRTEMQRERSTEIERILEQDRDCRTQKSNHDASRDTLETSPRVRDLTDTVHCEEREIAETKWEEQRRSNQ